MKKQTSIQRFFAISTILIFIMVVFVGCGKDEDAAAIHTSTTATEFINYTVNGIPYSFEVPTDNITSASRGLNSILRVMGYRIPVTQDSIIMAFDNNVISVGTYHDLASFKVNQIPGNATINAPIFVYITECGPTGQFIAGNFSGAYTGPGPTNIVYNVACNFRIKRTF